MDHELVFIWFNLKFLLKILLIEQEFKILFIEFYSRITSISLNRKIIKTI